MIQLLAGAIFARRSRGPQSSAWNPKCFWQPRFHLRTHTHDRRIVDVKENIPGAEEHWILSPITSPWRNTIATVIEFF
jgi:hypothetical protein